MYFKAIFLGLCLATLFAVATSVKGAHSNCHCRRMPNETNIGNDVSERTLQADIGRCAHFCRDEINGLPREANSSAAACIATEVQTESFPLLGSSRYVDSIQKCGRSSSEACRLSPHFKTYFNGTKFSRTLNVGLCDGVCARSGHKCEAVDSKTIAVEGPNGESEFKVPIIAQCACARARCHRIAFREIFKRKMDGDTWKEEVKDVGMCVGTVCPPFCLLLSCRDGSDPKLPCPRYCFQQDQVCKATNSTPETVWTGDFKPKKIQVIHDCGCE